VIEIIKDAPLLPSLGRGRPKKHPEVYELIERWEVGDSVVLNMTGYTKVGQRSPVVQCLEYAAKKAGQKIARRKNRQDATIQIWRVE